LLSARTQVLESEKKRADLEIERLKEEFSKRQMELSTQITALMSKADNALLSAKTQVLEAEKKRADLEIERLKEEFAKRQTELNAKIAILISETGRMRNEIEWLSDEVYRRDLFPISQLFLRDSGKPIWAVRRLLFHTDRSPRKLFKRIVLHKNGHPRKPFEKWLGATMHRSKVSKASLEQETAHIPMPIAVSQEDTEVAIRAELLKWRQGKRMYA
jgi:hypothetical protein